MAVHSSFTWVSNPPVAVKLAGFCGATLMLNVSVAVSRVSSSLALFASPAASVTV